MNVRCPHCHAVDPAQQVPGWSAGDWHEGKYLCDRCAHARIADIERRVHAPLGMNYAQEISIPVEIHIGFLCIIETPEQLERLKFDRSERSRSSVAVSRIETSQVVPRPVNRVAARVSGIHREIE